MNFRVIREGVPCPLTQRGGYSQQPSLQGIDQAVKQGIDADTNNRSRHQHICRLVIEQPQMLAQTGNDEREFTDLG